MKESKEQPAFESKTTFGWFVPSETDRQLPVEDGVNEQGGLARGASAAATDTALTRVLFVANLPAHNHAE